MGPTLPAYAHAHIHAGARRYPLAPLALTPGSRADPALGQLPGGRSAPQPLTWNWDPALPGRRLPWTPLTRQVAQV